MPAAIELADVAMKTESGRVLFQGLNLCLEHEHVALVGRNGVGKSTLLSLIAGKLSPSSGRIWTRGAPYFVPQLDERSAPMSRGELRRRTLDAARQANAEVMLLDEPSLHLDDDAVAWLRAWLSEFPGGLIVASHDRRLLADFRHFLVLSEAGGHYFGGPLDELEHHLEQTHLRQERRYAQALHRLAEHEARASRLARQSERKKRRGRFAALDQGTPRIMLNKLRGQAEVHLGRLAEMRRKRAEVMRTFTVNARRALDVTLELELPVPTLPPPNSEPIVTLRDVSARTTERTLFSRLNLSLHRDRVAVVGPNGAGKTTLLDIVTRRRPPDEGVVRADLARIGYVAQGGANWLLYASLREQLRELSVPDDEAARLLVGHRFPLGLAERPLRSLSPGERARAALLVLFARQPQVELLVLDEPTFSLDLVAQRALTEALRRWPGGLLLSSHDREFLERVGVERTIELSRS